jgi:hypothetical protein
MATPFSRPSRTRAGPGALVKGLLRDFTDLAASELTQQTRLYPPGIPAGRC